MRTFAVLLCLSCIAPSLTSALQPSAPWMAQPNYHVATVSTATPEATQQPKGLLPGWKTIALLPHEAREGPVLKWQSAELRDAPAWLRIVIAIDDREARTVRAVFAKSGEEAGCFDIRFASPFQPYDICLSKEAAQRAVRKGVRLREEARPGQPSTLLGTGQMRWLEEQLLDCDGPFIILSCGTMWTDHVSNGKDSWGRFAPDDRERIFRLIEEHQIGVVLLTSGDRHGACGYRIPRSPGFSLYEFGVGSLGGISGEQAPAGEAPIANGELLYRYGRGYAFGEFTFDMKALDPTVTFRLIQDDDQLLHEMTLSRSRLTPAPIP